VKLAELWKTVRNEAAADDDVAAIAARAVRLVKDHGLEASVIWAWARHGAADLRANMTGGKRSQPRPPAEGGQQTIWGLLPAAQGHAACLRYQRAYAGVMVRYPRVVATAELIGAYLDNGGEYSGTLVDTLRLADAPTDLLAYWAA